MSRWTWKTGQLFEVWLELHYEPDPRNPPTSFAVAYLSQPTGTVLTVQLEPGNLPISIDPGPVMDWVRLELDCLMSDFDVPFEPWPDGPCISDIGELPPGRPTTSAPVCCGGRRDIDLGESFLAISYSQTISRPATRCEMVPDSVSFPLPDTHFFTGDRRFSSSSTRCKIVRSSALIESSRVSTPFRSEE